MFAKFQDNLKSITMSLIKYKNYNFYIRIYKFYLFKPCSNVQFRSQIFIHLC